MAIDDGNVAPSSYYPTLEFSKKRKRGRNFFMVVVMPPEQH
jgi:hypothetical protein